MKPQIKKDNLELARPDLESQYEQPAQFEAGLKHSKTQQLRQHTGTLKSVYEHIRARSTRWASTPSSSGSSRRPSIFEI